MGITRLYMQDSVIKAARERMRWLLTEFDHFYVAFSGGKDSTVVLNLALEEAEKLGRLPVPVLFIDQEGEWQHTIDYVRQVMHDPRVKPYWLQVPILMNNAASIDSPWLECWHDGQGWLRAKEPDSIHRNVYGTKIFKDLFAAFYAYHHPRAKVAQVDGLRAEESPARALGTTVSEVYKGVTWGRCFSTKRPHYGFSPIYDWSYRDVWKAIDEHGWRYNGLYDKMYQYGLPVSRMRVSNVHHEQATQSLYFLQEIEPETWDKLVQRLPGINSIGQMKSSFYAPSELPRAFKDWFEYRDYLLVHLTDDTGRAFFTPRFAQMDADFADAPPDVKEAMAHAQITAILRNDWEEGTNLDGFRLRYWMHSAKTLEKRRAAELKSVPTSTPV